jgi:hypothetical protein
MSKENPCWKCGHLPEHCNCKHKPTTPFDAAKIQQEAHWDRINADKEKDAEIERLRGEVGRLKGGIDRYKNETDLADNRAEKAETDRDRLAAAVEELVGLLNENTQSACEKQRTYEYENCGECSRCRAHTFLKEWEAKLLTRAEAVLKVVEAAKRERCLCTNREANPCGECAPCLAKALDGGGEEKGGE